MLGFCGFAVSLPEPALRLFPLDEGYAGSWVLFSWCSPVDCWDSLWSETKTSGFRLVCSLITRKKSKIDSHVHWFYFRLQSIKFQIVKLFRRFRYSCNILPFQHVRTERTSSTWAKKLSSGDRWWWQEILVYIREMFADSRLLMRLVLAIL